MQSLKMFTTNSHKDTNPGAPATGKGPTWPPTLFDSLKLPSGKTVGEVPNEELRNELHRLGVHRAHLDGRHVIAERYGQLLADIGEAASEKAISEWLESKRG